MNEKHDCRSGFAAAYRASRSFIPAFIAICILLMGAFPAPALAQSAENKMDCGSLQNHYGPYDYTNPIHRREKLSVVEQYHFNDKVFRLERGMTAVNPRADIAYTLHAFPNHHRALDAYARLHRKHNTEQLPGARYTLDCYFERAKRLAPNDPVVPMLKAIHLWKTGRLDAAEKEFNAALKLAPDSAEIHYNLGLLNFRKGDYSAAREHATRAYDLGFPLPGLRNQLIGANQWPDAIGSE